MSKITPKTLSYDATLPPFLQRLQANNSSQDGRNEFQAARPKKARNVEDDAEDEPMFFDEESGETLTKREWEAKEKAKEEADGEKGVLEGSEDKKATVGRKKDEEKGAVAGIGGGKKRKAGKVIAADEDDGEEEQQGNVANEMKEVGNKDEKTGERKTYTKKGKKIKLSFGDDEGGSER